MRTIWHRLGRVYADSALISAKIIEVRHMSESFSRREALKGFALVVGAAGALRVAPSPGRPIWRI
jgi:hypothetical protein